MAINSNDYKKVAQNLKVNKKNMREFLFDFRVNEKRYRKIELFTERTGWNKKDYEREAQLLLIDYRKKVEANTGNLQITSNTKLNELWELYFQTLDKSTSWTFTKESFYKRYLKEALGKKKIDSIQEHNIMAIISVRRSAKLGSRKCNLRVAF